MLPMHSPPRLRERLLARFSIEDRNIFMVQLAVMFVVITLLNLGFYHGRELRDLEAHQNLRPVMHGWDGLVWYVWLAAAPAMLLLIRKFPLNRGDTASNLLRLAVGSIAVYFVVANVRYALRVGPYLWMHDPGGLPLDWPAWRRTLMVLLPIDFLTYCGFFCLTLALDSFFRYRQRADYIGHLQLEAARLQSELTQAQLATLRGQLHPHFLFNAFNAVSTLVRQQKNEAAVNMITQLGSMLRLTMQNIDSQELSLEQELDFVSAYLDVERVRFSDKLVTALEVDPAARRCIVPNLLLQPLVENAIKHGISRRVSKGCVRLTAARQGRRLVLEVIDDGPGDDPGVAPPSPSGIGLRNTRCRLRHAYHDDFKLSILQRAGGGTIVRLDLPWRETLAAVPLPAVEEAVLA
jgi:two-component system LytT family sensor kinase